MGVSGIHQKRQSLFIPETRGGEVGVARAFFAFGQFNAACFSPFGIDDDGHAGDDPLDEGYAVLRKLSPIILAHQGMGTMKGILVDTLSPVQQLELGEYRIEQGSQDHADRVLPEVLSSRQVPGSSLSPGRRLIFCSSPKMIPCALEYNQSTRGLLTKAHGCRREG